MKNKRMRVAALAACLIVLLAGSGVELLARGQGTFYNPNIYNNTRRSMSNRAAARAALKRKRAKRAMRARRAARRANTR